MTVQIALVEVSVKDFAQFHEFYAGELLNGRALSRTMGLDVAIVAFHPDCSLIFEAVFTSTGLIDMIVRWEFEEHDFWVNQRKASLFSTNCLGGNPRITFQLFKPKSWCGDLWNFRETFPHVH